MWDLNISERNPPRVKYCLRYPPGLCFLSEEKLPGQSWYIPLLSYLHDDSGRDRDSPQLSRSRLSPEGVAWDCSEVAGFARNIFSSVLNISPQSLLPSPPTEAPYSLEDVVQHFLKTAPSNQRLLGTKEGLDMKRRRKPVERDRDSSSGEDNLQSSYWLILSWINGTILF